MKGFFLYLKSLNPLLSTLLFLLSNGMSSLFIYKFNIIVHCLTSKSFDRNNTFLELNKRNRKTND